LKKYNRAEKCWTAITRIASARTANVVLVANVANEELHFQSDVQINTRRI